MRAVFACSTATAMLMAFVGPSVAQDYYYTQLDLDACEVFKAYEESGGVDLRCDGLAGFDVFVSDGDARMDVDFGTRNDTFQTFSAFNGVGETVEWMSDENGMQAATIRFLIDVDGRSAQALVVSKVGIPGAAPGCVIGVVNAASEQANGVARGIAAMAPGFECGSDRIAVLAGKNELVRNFSAAQQ